jgi:outer membrane cobalamin receptor
MPAFAEKADETAPITIVITGSRQDSNLTSRSTNTIVFDEEQLKTSRDSSVQNVVSRVPGVFADHVGTMGATGSVYLRGGDPNFTAVRIDGVQVNNPTNSRGGSFELTELRSCAGRFLLYMVPMR